MRILKNSILLVAAKGLNLMVGFLLIPYLARVLSYEAYGTYGAVLIAFSIFTIFATWGYSQVLYVHLGRDDRGGLFSNILVLALGSGTLAAAVMFFGADGIAVLLGEAGTASGMRVYAPALAFTALNQCFTSCYIYSDRVRTWVLIQAVTNLAKIALVVAAVELFGSLDLVFVALTVVTGLQSLLLYIWLPMPFEASKVSRAEWGPILSESAYIGLTNAVGAVFVYIDSIMVLRLLGTESYAIYRNGAMEIPLLATVYASVAAAVLPEVSKLFGEGGLERIVQLKRRVISSLAVIVFPVTMFVILNADTLIPLYMGDMYVESVPVFVVYSLIVFLRVNDYQDVIMVAGRSRLLLYNSLMIIGLNIGLNLLLIPEMGILGAAVATTVAKLVGLADMSWRSARILGVPVWTYLAGNRLLGVGTVSLLVFGGFWLAPAPTVLLPVELAVGSAIVLWVSLKAGYLATQELMTLSERFPWLRPVLSRLAAYEEAA